MQLMNRIILNLSYHVSYNYGTLRDDQILKGCDNLKTKYYWNMEGYFVK